MTLDDKPALPDAVAATSLEPAALHARLCRLETLSSLERDIDDARSWLLHAAARAAGAPRDALRPDLVALLDRSVVAYGRACRRRDLLLFEARRLAQARGEIDADGA